MPGVLGSILVIFSAVPLVGALFGIVGFFLILVAIRRISEAVYDKSIFSYVLVSVVLATAGLVLGAFVIMGRILRFVGLNNLVGPQPFGQNFGPSTIHAGDWAGLFISILPILFVLWILLLSSAIFVRKTYTSIAARLHADRFRTACLVYLIGSATTIILVGFVLLLVAQIIFVAAFFSMEEKLPATPIPQITPIAPAASQPKPQPSLKMTNGSRYPTLILGGLVVVAGLVVGLVIAIVLFRDGLPSPNYFQTERALADITGFLGVGMTVASGAMMPFKKPLLARTQDRTGLRWVHYIIAGVGGFFVVLHVVFSLAFFLTLQVLLGAVATGAVLFIWITGLILVEDLRTFLPYHSLLSFIGVFLILVHTFGAGTNIPDMTPSVSLSFIVLVVLLGVAGEIAHFLKSRR